MTCWEKLSFTVNKTQINETSSYSKKKSLSAPDAQLEAFRILYQSQKETRKIIQEKKEQRKKNSGKSLRFAAWNKVSAYNDRCTRRYFSATLILLPRAF